jgi:6-phosphogluconate dehydrogenase
MKFFVVVLWVQPTTPQQKISLPAQGTRDNGVRLLNCGLIVLAYFVEMIHNSTEYDMLQAYGEGFEIVNTSQYNLDRYTISHLWNQDSAVRSWLQELAENAFQKDSKLETIKGDVADSGKGCWIVQLAIGTGIPAPVITLSLLKRFRSQHNEPCKGNCSAA